jgi:predicted N-acyltransferase
MVMDYVANKRKFNFSYAAITSTDLNVILEELWSDLATSHNCFHTLTYLNELNVTVSVTVYAGAIPTKLHRADGKEWVWKDVSFSLIER